MFNSFFFGSKVQVKSGEIERMTRAQDCWCDQKHQDIVKVNSALTSAVGALQGSLTVPLKILGSLTVPLKIH
jgi:hypothetical protein